MRIAYVQLVAAHFLLKNDSVSLVSRSTLSHVQIRWENRQDHGFCSPGPVMELDPKEIIFNRLS